MSLDRREFLRNAGSAAALAAIGGGIAPVAGLAQRTAVGRAASPPPAMDPVVRELLTEALDEARRGGAEFADARIARTRTNSIRTREQQIVNVSEGD